MDKPENVALIGFRGTGKTQIGRRLSKRLNMRFVDTDKEIVKETGKSIPQIFSEQGEEGFREIEKRVVKRVSEMRDVCVACGGGIVLFDENIENLKKNSTIILLEAKPNVIFRRIKRDRNRPSLTNKEGIEEIEHLLGERKEKYEKAADFIINTSKVTIYGNVQEIIDILNEKGLI